MQGLFIAKHAVGNHFAIEGQSVNILTSQWALDWFSKRTGTSFQNVARRKNTDNKLGWERRQVVLKGDLARKTRCNFLF